MKTNDRSLDLKKTYFSHYWFRPEHAARTDRQSEVFNDTGWPNKTMPWHKQGLYLWESIVSPFWTNRSSRSVISWWSKLSIQWTLNEHFCYFDFKAKIHQEIKARVWNSISVHFPKEKRNPLLLLTVVSITYRLTYKDMSFKTVQLTSQLAWTSWGYFCHKLIHGSCKTARNKRVLVLRWVLHWLFVCEGDSEQR